MAIASLAFITLLEPLQAAVQWLAGGTASTSRSAVQACMRRPAASARSRPNASIALPEIPARSVLRAWSGPTRAHAPVRVVHRGAAARGASGRLVISGRLMDVCAELERLAALEDAQLQ